MKAHEQIIAPGAEEGWAYADDGFFFGIGAFETIAVSGQTPLFLDEHLTRMEETLKFSASKPHTRTCRRLRCARAQNLTQQANGP